MSWPVTPALYTVTVEAAIQIDLELVEITSFGHPPTYLETRRGWIIECWSDWEWIDR